MPVFNNGTVSYGVGNGSQTVFTYPFEIPADADINVYIGTTLKTLTTDYTVQNAGNDNGGTITFVTAPANLAIVTMNRNVVPERLQDYNDHGGFAAEALDEDLDKIWMIIQAFLTGVNRSVRQAITDNTTLDLELPAGFANGFLTLNAAGDGFEWKAITDYGSITIPIPIADGGTNATTAAAARTNLGLVIGTDVEAYDADNAKTDVVQNYTASQSGTVTTLTSGTNVAVNMALSNNFLLTLATNATLDNPTNPVAGTSGIITVKQDGTGGKTLAFGSNYKFDANAGVAALTATANAIDVFGYYVVDTTTILLTASLDWS